MPFTVTATVIDKPNQTLPNGRVGHAAASHPCDLGLRTVNVALCAGWALDAVKSVIYTRLKTHE